MTLLHEKFLGVKLNEAEEQALIIWANSEGIEKKSVFMRRLFRMALKDAPRSIFPDHILAALNLSVGDGQS